MRYRYVTKECVLFFFSSSNGRNVTKTVLLFHTVARHFKLLCYVTAEILFLPSPADHMDIDAFEVEIGRF